MLLYLFKLNLMKLVRTCSLLLFASVILLSPACGQKLTTDNPSELPPHPRILMLSGEEAAVKQMVVADKVWNDIDVFITEECNKLITVAPVERVLIGRRLLDKSREALRRIFYLSYAYRMTSGQKYLDRAEKEMLAVAKFSDWNPSHFLDVAEMTMAVSIGYDWLYKGLSEESRKVIREAIITKGLKPSLLSENNSWLKGSNNWNQVCNAGITFGALAIYESDPELAKSLIKRAAETIVLPMNDYQPDGAYPEGYSYWGYGTSFNVLYLSAIEKIYGKESGIQINDGFLKTAEYMKNMTGPSGMPFNYSDCGGSGEMQPAMVWYATRLADPSVMWSEKYFLTNRKPSNDRILPAALIWSAGLTMEDIVPPSGTIWVGQGKNPVALLRSSWTDPNAIFVGLKGGSPSVNHGHMDAGSFVMDANGVRWAMDFGMQDYNSLETAGVDLWNMKQNSQRWEVFRYNNFVHNTLTVNNQLQVVGGYAGITNYSASQNFTNAVTDISSLYAGTLSKAVRGIAIVDRKYVMVRDEVEASATASKIWWNFLTSADVKITGPATAELTKNGKKLIMKVIEPANITLTTRSTTPPHSFDAQNPGTIMVGFEAGVPSGTKQSLTVILLPEGVSENTSVSGMKIADWPKTR